MTCGSMWLLFLYFPYIMCLCTRVFWDEQCLNKSVLPTWIPPRWYIWEKIARRGYFPLSKIIKLLLRWLSIPHPMYMRERERESKKRVFPFEQIRITFKMTEHAMQDDWALNSRTVSYYRLLPLIKRKHLEILIF